MNERILRMPLISVILSDLTTRVLTQMHYRIHLLFINICHSILILCHSDLKAFFVFRGGVFFFVFCFVFCFAATEAQRVVNGALFPTSQCYGPQQAFSLTAMLYSVDWWNAGWYESDSRHKHCVCLIEVAIRYEEPFSF